MPQRPQTRCPSLPTARILFTIASVAALFTRFFHHGLLLGFFQDDFYYYLKIADNLAQHGLSSFDGTHLTNGYHPLWLLTFTLLRLLLRGAPFFVALQALTLACALLCFAAAERIFRTLHVPNPLCSLGPFLVSMQALLLLRYGMEVTLALPLGLWLVAYLLDVDATTRPPTVLWLSLLASLTVLARLDAALLIASLFLALLLTTSHLRSRTHLLSLALGGIPLYLYLLINHRVFHLLLPVSSHAKQLKSTLLPSSSTVLGLLHPLDRMKMIFILPCLLLLAAGLLAFLRASRNLPRSHAAILLAALLFPLLQVSALSTLSDWTLWPWYFYSFVFSSAASIALLAIIPLPGAHTLASRALLPASLMLAGAYLAYIAAYSALLPTSVGIYTSSRALASYMDAHPGIYAMGDQAGTTAFLSSQPVIQLEGLVMDADFLRKIKAQEPLRQILADYGANFYVTLAPATAQPCLSVREPSQAGPHSPTSKGVICSAPLATFYRDNVIPIRVFDAHAVQ